ncbi:pyrroline-5-carboxylate reductase [Breznakia sp. PF5-3]|uniref:pyrroline-5-carboxylate reductase n=1 Tax=unclassified Breznakia TaxID=2623764 RepID=UPI0024050ADF|nr:MULTISPECIES: pyrroline-5-carboxylate reductase [unclassified Breznakia]MDF9824629.1 pyrroline-5-carboxylate reductase [Breznakia sp. PM6-1]MDF9835565.1 pyrroline-5-carboxylate reductase [Breznakia sp. PF5-3]MDF9838683.1 pyrroline-5-carboxylate reductase [Breznakia sp. PFB2-8]MDF9860714.1 pyrroline-5-carboxylate reductase [Breznakia sp. PH5-24]
MGKKIGFIGAGNMGGAILAGALKANAFAASDTYVYSIDEERLKHMEKEYGIQVCKNNQEVYQKSDVIILAVKPNLFETIIEELRVNYVKEKVIVSIAAGITLKKLDNFFQKENVNAIRIMPNTPALVNEGASGICKSEFVNEDDFTFVKDIFSAIGIVEEIDESQMDAVVATSGSSPAYAFMFIDAIIKESMVLGLSYDVAKKLAAQSVLGAAKMVLESELTPDQLKQNVCSPNGTTIEAVGVLETLGLTEIVAKAMQACAEKSKQMSE